MSSMPLARPERVLSHSSKSAVSQRFVAEFVAALPPKSEPSPLSTQLSAGTESEPGTTQDPIATQEE